MESAAGFSYTYDGDGKRVQKSTGKLYWYGMGSEALAESDAAGNITDEYIFFGGKRVARNNSTSGITYYFADHLGTSRVVTNATGTTLDDSDFYPFGGERPVVSSSGNNYKFTGKERDSESGLDDFGARYYSSQYGRWVSPDWSETPEPVPYGDLSNPQSLNLYGYVRNNPMNSTDLDGHDDPEETIKAVLTAVDFLVGAVRGAAASISYGAAPASRPSESDSLASRLGQALGTAVVGGVGTTAAVGGAADVVACGGSGAACATLPAVLPEAVAGGVAAVGAAKNAGDIITTPIESRRVGEFSQSTKQQKYDENAAKNGGQNVCENCGERLAPGQKSEKGVTPPKNERQLDHKQPLSQGGSNNPNNAAVVCRECNLKKGVKTKPEPQ